MAKNPPKTSPPQKSDEFKAFEKLTKGLVSVPKKEIDKEGAKTSNGKRK